MSAKSHTVMIGDLEVHYLEEGRGQPLLLLHGWRGRSAGTRSRSRCRW